MRWVLNTFDVVLYNWKKRNLLERLSRIRNVFFGYSVGLKTGAPGHRIKYISLIGIVKSKDNISLK